jgi:hypothetical protein
MKWGLYVETVGNYGIARKIGLFPTEPIK